MNKNSKIFVAGHNGLSGSAIVRQLKAQGYQYVLTAEKTSLDLRNQASVHEWFKTNQPEFVFLSAAKVGGIYANQTYPADFISDNLHIQNNVIHISHLFGVKKLVFTGSICIYPKFANEPVQESSLLTGLVEPANEWYAIAKIAGVKMCQAYKKQYGDNFISAMPCNLYGLYDNFHPQNSHVLPALIRRFFEANAKKSDIVECWGDGSPRREFLNSMDLAEALILLMHAYNDNEIINVGYGSDFTIKEVAEMVKKSSGFEGEIRWNIQFPNGTPRRLLDVSKIFAMGWKPKISLQEGINETFKWFADNYHCIRSK